ncbi:uncharacterized protein ACJ7VT_016837 [Polymixia lowei]
MSRPRSRSPHYRMSPRWHEETGGRSRKFPWDEPDFDPQKVLDDLDQMPFDRDRRLRGDPKDNWTYLREDVRSEGQRRSPSFRDTRQLGHQRHPHPEEFYRRTPPSLPDELGYAERRRLSPKQVLHRHDGRGDGDRGRGEFRDLFESFENRERPPRSPQRLPRERLPPMASSHSNPQQREPLIGWRREDQGRGQGASRDCSPRARSDTQGRGEGPGRGRRDTHAPHRERQRDDSHWERSPFSKRHRRELDGALHLGYGKEEEFRERQGSLERPRDGLGGRPGEHSDTQGRFPHGEGRSSGPLVVEHDHGITNHRGLPQWEPFVDSRDHNPDFDREGHPRQTVSSQEHFRKSNSRLDAKEETRGRPVHDGVRRSPMQQDRTSSVGFANRGGPMNHRGRGSTNPARGRMNPGRGGRMVTGPPRNHSSLQQFPQGHQNQRHGYRPMEENRHMEPRQEEPDWTEETKLKQWECDRPGGTDRHLPRVGLDPKMPRHRARNWKSQQITTETVVSEETLTIKVDMNRPVNKNSQLCYSSDRQLSLDLVNVGRQRLDFLPMLEHSGTYRESAAHTGAFAQEVITLVHQVKEQYFRGDRITLNERFSASQDGGFPKEEEEEEVEEEGPTLNRRFTMSMNSDEYDAEPLFSRSQPQTQRQQPVRDPGDLRHDLERRRQERMEGVMVTIPGGSLSQRPLGPGSEQMVAYGDKEVIGAVDEGGLSSWSEEPQQAQRYGSNMGPRRGAPYRHNTGPHPRKSRLDNRLGPMRLQKHPNNDAGAGW